ncbi:hypothetical protein [Rhodococcus sp. 24CO]|uniref:hypothetical protein n=1 Tax=Rhodococcus sp. 24CO TaxID=3117460 RepID=UPI003D33D6D8
MRSLYGFLTCTSRFRLEPIALHHALIALREFRNRVAHHEPILLAPESAHRQIVYVTKLLSPRALAHLNDHSQVSKILAHKP